VRDNLEKILEGILKKKCSELTKERVKNKTLFFCRGELAGSVVELSEDTLAGTVYSNSIGDSIHKEFLEIVRDEFGGRIKEEGTRTSSGVDQNFYYTYVHVKL